MNGSKPEKVAHDNMNPPCYVIRFNRGAKVHDFESMDGYNAVIKEHPDFPMAPRRVLNYVRSMVSQEIEAVRFKRDLEPPNAVCPYQFFKWVDVIESLEFEGEAELIILCKGDFDDRKLARYARDDEPIAYSRKVKSGEKLDLLDLYQEPSFSAHHMYFVKCKNPVKAVVIDYLGPKTGAFEPIDIKALGFRFDIEYN